MINLSVSALAPCASVVPLSALAAGFGRAAVGETNPELFERGPPAGPIAASGPTKVTTSN